MIIQKSAKQGVLFATPFDQELDLDNRWVKFSNIIPWDDLSSFYLRRMHQTMGAGIKDARIVLGAMIIKHRESLSDEGTIASIQENLYMQYFLGLPSFKKDAVFAPSLFVEIRKRLGLDYWQEINEIIIKHNEQKKDDNVAKKKRRTHKEIRKAVRSQLNFVSRDLKHIDTLLLGQIDLRSLFNKYQLQYLQVVNEVYRQQKEMHTKRVHSTLNRIVSIHQPHVRPMVRGKAGSDVEFGSKIGICVHNGLTYLDHLSWNSYNETEDLKSSSENYKKRNGYYPEKINADQIYITRENRKWCKENNILLNGKPLGRPTEQTKERIKELRKAVGERNCVEGKFGQAKRWYGMGNIHAKLNTTSESMIGAIVVVLNLIRLVQQHVLTFFEFVFLCVENYVQNFTFFKKWKITF